MILKDEIDMEIDVKWEESITDELGISPCVLIFSYSCTIRIMHVELCLNSDGVA